MSIGHRVQEIWLHKVTHAHQNHKTWLTSWAYSSKSEGVSPPHVRIFRKYRNRSLTWCKSGLHSSLRSWAIGAWISPISEASSWTRLLTSLVSRPHFSRPPEKWVWSTAYSIFVQVRRNVGALFFSNLTLDVIDDCIRHCVRKIY